jgi:PPK2 family polyphosphate:nucleotide phosphotransferase
VEPGTRARLDERDPGWDGDDEPHLRTLAKGRHAQDDLRQAAEASLDRSRQELEAAQELLYASDTWAVLVVFQAMDAAGKDGTIKHVMAGVNPQGCQVYSFKKPSTEELDHDFLWRCVKALPERGRIGIFNRSYYEEVLVVRVHPDLLAHQQLPEGRRSRPDKDLWAGRYDDINNFERHLDRNGTKVVKLFLHVSKHEQRKRFLDRLEDPDKLWKFSAADYDERKRWDDYQAAYEEAITATSTKWAPWYVVPADHKWLMRAVVAGILVDTIEGLDLHYPQVLAAQRADYDRIRAELEAEIRL